MNNRRVGIEKLKECLGEEVVQKIELIEYNDKLIKENQMLIESCENFAEVEGNLHRKINNMQQEKSELVKVLNELTQQFATQLGTVCKLGEVKPYLKALKILEKYETSLNI